MSSVASTGLEVLQPTHHGNWEPRRALTLSAARRRTQFVRFMRFGFMAASAAIVLTILLQLFQGNSGEAGEAPEAVTADVRMINPRFTGRDENLTPYTVTADVAIRRRGDASGLTELERPRLEYNFLDTTQDESQVLAETGYFDAENRVLNLHSDVNLRTDSGYTFITEHARIFLREERVLGEQSVEGSGPMGSMRADTFEIRDGGNHIILDGNVRTRLIQNRTASDAAGETE